MKKHESVGSDKIVDFFLYSIDIYGDGALVFRVINMFRKLYACLYIGVILHIQDIHEDTKSERKQHI